MRDGVIKHLLQSHTESNNHWIGCVKGAVMTRLSGSGWEGKSTDYRERCGGEDAELHRQILVLWV
jgi:hypothetical protein